MIPCVKEERSTFFPEPLAALNSASFSSSSSLDSSNFSSASPREDAMISTWAAVLSTSDCAAATAFLASSSVSIASPSALLSSALVLPEPSRSERTSSSSDCASANILSHSSS